MKQDGLQRMLDFLNYLEANNIHYFITKYSESGLTATLTLVGVRIEVEFTPEEMQYSIFRRNEHVLTDEKELMDIIRRDLE